MSLMNSTQTPFNAEFLLSVILKYKKQFGIVAIASVVLSLVFSSEYFIKPKYKSFAIVYPVNLTAYSTESETEQMLQLLESDDIKNALIKDFDLYNHYEIDTNGKYPLTELYGTMKGNISIDKTKFESVEIIVYDTDPKIACDMIDSILSKYHKMAQHLQRSKAEEYLIMVKTQFDLKKAEMDSMEAALKKIRVDYDILDFEEQVKSFSRTYYKELAAGKAGENSNSTMEKTMQNLLNHGGEYMALKEHLWRVRGHYNDIKKDYEGAKQNITKELTYSSVVTSPIPAEKKSYPIRSVIVFAFTLSMIVLTFLVLTIMDNISRVRKNKDSLSNANSASA
jgi:hypothetical protein